jgi:large subunit ribosomal protein L22
MGHKKDYDKRKEARLGRRPLQLTAVGRFLRCPPDKARLRARTLSGLQVENALSLLRNSPTSSARLILKVLYSALYNAVNGEAKYEPEQLFVDRVVVDKGRFLKRHQPVSHGKAEPILKRTCHITVVLRSRKKQESKA